MLITLLGPDLYASRQRLRELVSERDAVWLSAEDGLSRMMESIGQADLFGQSPSVVLEAVLAMPIVDQKRLAGHLPVALSSDQLVVVMVPDETMSAKNELAAVLQRGRVEQFAASTTAGLMKWVQQESERLHIAVDKSVLPQFISMFGDNKFAMATELARLSWMDQPLLNNASLQTIQPLGVEANVFAVTDAWAQKNMTETLSQLRLLWRQQTASQYALSLFERQARLLYLCFMATPSGGDMASILNLPRFAATKLMAASKKWSPEAIRRALEGLYQLDTAIKTGRIEPEFGLERWVVESLVRA